MAFCIISRLVARALGRARDIKENSSPRINHSTIGLLIEKTILRILACTAEFSPSTAVFQLKISRIIMKLWYTDAKIMLKAVLIVILVSRPYIATDADSNFYLQASSFNKINSHYFNCKFNERDRFHNTDRRFYQHVNQKTWFLIYGIPQLVTADSEKTIYFYKNFNNGKVS